MRILGIDPGFERLGIAILERSSGKEKVLFSECFKTSSDLEFDSRLRLLGEEVQKVIKKFKPEILAIETLFFTTNQKTVMRVAETRGVVIYESSLAGLRVHEFSPPQIKMATTGYGKANKEQIIRMVNILVDMGVKKNSTKGKTSDDEMDAIAVALTAFAHIKN